VSEQYTDEELLADLRSVADDLGHAPSRSEYNRLGEACATAPRRRFGGWGAALRAAGLEPRGHGKGGEAFQGSKFDHLVGAEGGESA